jgi:uncharacterized membrane protein
MNSKPNFTNNAWNSFNWLLAALALALAPPAGAETPPAAIPFSGIGARATAGYQGDALGVTATSDGARLRCGFQKLEGHATPEGLWLESTKPGGGKLRLLATNLSRDTGFDLNLPPSTFNLQPSTSVPPIGTVSVQDKLVRFTRPGLTEEYSVSVDGVRQDFIIESPPLNPPPSAVLLRRTGQRSTLNQPAGDLLVELALSGARAEAAAGGARLTFEGSGRTLAYSRLRVEDATGRELTARLEVLSVDRLAVSVADADATYPVRIDPTFSDADWVSLGSGMNDIVFALAVSGTNLYAGGFFGEPASMIAKWDGIAWSALGWGMSDGVRALAVSGTNLYAGGYFTTAGGVTANHIAKWDGSAWSALGSGMDTTYGYVYALAASGTDLYAGGDLSTAGGVPVNHIAKWNGSAWSALGWLSDKVLALAVSGTNLYAGGSFTLAGEVNANYVAKWNGSVWSALGSGMSGWVYALAASGTNLYAGGWFTTAGGLSATNIAKWDGSAWSALGSGMNDAVLALGADGAGHLFVGGRFSLAGTNVFPYIAQANLTSAPPVIVASPASLAVGVGATANFQVAATGSAPLVYQWVFNRMTAIAGATSSMLSLANVQLTQAGSYSVTVTNLYGAVTSAPAVLTVTGAPPVIVASPASLAVGVGATANFQVAATGWPLPVYQWVFNGTTAIAGATSSMLSLANVQLTQAGTYSVTVTNLYGAVTSAPAVLTVTGAPPVIVASPASLAAAFGATANFQVAATGWPLPVYQWVFNGTTLMDGATSSVLSLTNVQFAQAGAYSVIVSNLYGAVTSAPAVLTVTGAPPVIVASPASLAVPLGATAGFQVEATGSPPLVYQWVFNGTNAIAGATSSALSLTNVQFTQAGTYSVTVTNLYGAVTSAPAMLQVFPRSVVLTNSEAALRAAMAGGGTVTFACDGTITLASTITDNVNLTLDGSGHQVTISGNNAVQLVYVATNVQLTILNLRFANGLSANGGALFNAGGSVSATNCVFTGNRAAGPAGSGIGADGGIGAGGAIYNAGSFIASQCAFLGNTAQGGRGTDGNPVAVAQPPPTGKGGWGEGAALCNVGVATLERSLFANNSASGGWGGAGSAGSYNLLYSYATIGGQGGAGAGGALYNAGTATLVNCTLAGNSGSGGNGSSGGYQAGHWPPIRFGPSGGDGGAGIGCIYSTNGPLIMTNCTVASNFASGGTGGSGGGCSLYQGDGGRGGMAVGGAYVQSPALLINTIAASNSGSGGSGGYGCRDTGNPPITCGYSGNWGVYTNLYGSVSDLGHNLSSDWCFTSATSFNYTDPKLGPLANNGGPTLTMALLPGSPAIDAADPAAAPVTDQRGIARPVGPAPDIGAFEYGLPAVLRISGSQGTGLDLLVSAYPGLSCRLLAGSDLSNLMPVATNQLGSDGTCVFHENWAPGRACRFYRLVMP